MVGGEAAEPSGLYFKACYPAVSLCLLSSFLTREKFLHRSFPCIGKEHDGSQEKTVSIRGEKRTTARQNETG